MTELSKKIFDEYQVRKKKAQKLKFIEFLKSEIPELKVENGGSLKGENLVIGDLQSSKVILGAHYDTCANLPFPNFLTPKNILVYILYNIAIIIPVFLLSFITGFLARKIAIAAPNLEPLMFIIASFSATFWCLGLIALMLFNKPNEHTANDNTSGVITLIEIYKNMTTEQRAKTTFVFFDNEEAGLLGSSYFTKVHKRLIQDKLMINFDCVSDGDYLMFILNKKARLAHEDKLKNSFGKVEDKTIIFDKAISTLYPSDQMGFPCNVGVAAFNRKKFIGLYVDKIHTKHDKVFDLRNIDYLTKSTIDFVDTI